MMENTDSVYQSKLKLITNLLLIFTTILWGKSFIVTKYLTQNVPIFFYLGIRFSIAVFGFFPYLIRIKRVNKKILLFGTLTGLMYYIAIVFQTLGIQTSTVNKAAFIIGLSTILVLFIFGYVLEKPSRREYGLP